MNEPSDFAQTHEGANSFDIPHQTNRWGIDDRKTLHVRYGHLCLSTWASIIQTGVPYFQHPCTFSCFQWAFLGNISIIFSGKKIFPEKDFSIQQIALLGERENVDKCEYVYSTRKKKEFLKGYFFCVPGYYLSFCTFD